jgi:hypothetical protein
MLQAGNPNYLKKMGETLGKFGACQTVADFQEVANQFGIIAQVEKEAWLPFYYQAQCYVLMSFMEKSSPQKKDEYLDAANIPFEKMLTLVPNESEVYTLQAFYYTARLVVNPQERGQKFGSLSAQAVGKALALEPENPRAQYIQLSNQMGTARFFGQDTKPFCEKATTLLKNWDAYTIKSPIHPSWGKSQVEQMVNQCKE